MFGLTVLLFLPSFWKMFLIKNSCPYFQYLFIFIADLNCTKRGENHFRIINLPFPNNGWELSFVNLPSGWDIENISSKLYRWVAFAHEFFTWRTLQSEGKNHGTLNQKILSLFYSRITNVTLLHNLEGIFSVSLLFGWHTKDNSY